ncbi:uncharacterized protein LOC124938821 [Impatiens glandulifera]|uniref:uncharacterized protein LOC124938821 n=1 Tax=Impatiens glandulifera TaxID=253017 RepID=UPI001FB1624C|nr:uncharacterized protein LOC124938821 [Impatiens glandulifera]
MAVSFKYWDDCIDPQDMEAMWMDHAVKREWVNAGENKGSKVHLSRDPDGQPYLTQIEMKALAGIIVSRHFISKIDSDMVCAIAELESDRKPLTTRYNKKTKETSIGIMQMLPRTANWLISDMGYKMYQIEQNSDLLYRPFVNVYLGAAYLSWYSKYDQIERSEEFIVRAFKGGPKKATDKTTLDYWKRYLAAKESLPSRKVFDVGVAMNDPSASVAPNHHPSSAFSTETTWESKASPEDMLEMWNSPSVSKEWNKSGNKRDKVHFSRDDKKRPYLSRVELRAVAEIILSKHFSTRGVKPTILCAIAEIVSMRFLNGVGPRPGIMGVDYPTACWLYKDLGYKAYRVECADDMTKPFVSVYFGAAYMVWLSLYGGRERSPQFVVQAYIGGPKNVNRQETGPVLLKFENALSRYEDMKKDQEGCNIM